MDLTKQFFKYVSQNIFGLLGTSCYILADTYFIAQAAGTDGVTLLNLCLPIYNFIFAIGSMICLLYTSSRCCRCWTRFIAAKCGTSWTR